MSIKNLASRLCYLPLFVADRVKLWLTYKGLKPASLIAFSPLVYPMTPKRLHRVLNWIKDADLYSQLDPLAPEKNIFIVSKDLSAIEELSKMEPPSYDKDQREDTYRMGILFGYPPKAVKTFAYCHRSQIADPTGKDSPIKNWPESLYAQFAVRTGYEKEDIKVARKWMDTIRKDIPKLARWYEKEAQTVVENYTPGTKSRGVRA